MERAGEGHAAGGIPADLIRAFWHEGWNLRSVTQDKALEKTSTDESNVSDKTAPVSWQRHPANNPEETPSLMVTAAPPVASPLPTSKTTNLTRSRSAGARFMRGIVLYSRAT
jgi:hypothetical protein